MNKEMNFLKIILFLLLIFAISYYSLFFFFKNSKPKNIMTKIKTKKRKEKKAQKI